MFNNFKFGSIMQFMCVPTKRASLIPSHNNMKINCSTHGFPSNIREQINPCFGYGFSCQLVHSMRANWFPPMHTSLKFGWLILWACQMSFPTELNVFFQFSFHIQLFCKLHKGAKKCSTKWVWTPQVKSLLVCECQLFKCLNIHSMAHVFYSHAIVGGKHHSLII
jgi:hypothetical protein